MDVKQVNHKIEPRSIRDAIASDPTIQIIDRQVKRLLETSIDPIYIGEDGRRLIKDFKGPTEKRVDALIRVREDQILSIIKRMQNPKQ